MGVNFLLFFCHMYTALGAEEAHSPEMPMDTHRKKAPTEACCLTKGPGTGKPSKTKKIKDSNFWHHKESDTTERLN